MATKKQEAEKLEAREYLRKILSPGNTVMTMNDKDTVRNFLNQQIKQKFEEAQNPVNERAQSLAKFLQCEVGELTESKHDETQFEHGDAEYMELEELVELASQWNKKLSHFITRLRFTMPIAALITLAELGM